MSKSSEKKWLELFYGLWDYEPPSLIRKTKHYRGEVTFDDAMNICGENGIQWHVRIVNPYNGKEYTVDKQNGGYKHYKCDPNRSIAIFPQTISEEQINPKGAFEVDETVLYDGVLYHFTKFAKVAPAPDTGWVVNNHWSLNLPIELFMKTTKEFNAYKKHCLAPVRKLIVKFDSSLDYRGKLKNIDSLTKRNAYILELSKNIKCNTGSALVAKIDTALQSKAAELYPNKNQIRDYNRFSCSRSNIRTLLEANEILPIKK